ncbi:MAG: hypothetical protein U0S49_15235 [Rhodospirillales bacterium]|nr:hypothetical protein [Rhodospirillales bacterium]
MRLQRQHYAGRRRSGERIGLAAAFFTLAAGALLAAAPLGATEAPVPGTAAWSLVHEAGQGYCLAHAFFPRSRLALGFVSDGERVGVALVHGAWRLHEWQEYDVAFRFDGGPAVRTRLVATDATAMASELDAEAEQGFRRASAVEINAPGAPAGGRLSLAGSARAIDYVRACGEIAAQNLDPAQAMEEGNAASIRD